MTSSESTTIRQDASDRAEHDLLAVSDVRVQFKLGRSLPGRPARRVTAVDGVDLDVAPGETVALVGESGCGKTTLGRVIARLQQADEGTIRFRGDDVSAYRGKQLRHYRSNVQMIFQDPFTSLNPRLTIRDVVSEPLRINRTDDRSSIDRRAADLLDAVGIPARQIDRKSRAFSGGQRQRVAIARALALDPELIVCDEPVSALDMSVQARIINLLVDLRQEFDLAYLFISHDLGVVRHIADRVAVMYLGRIVELGPTDQIFGDPQHPYTRALLESVPDPYHRLGTPVVRGEVPSNVDVSVGCSFAPRCDLRMDVCTEHRPPLEPDGSASQVACFAAPPIASPIDVSERRTEEG